MTKGDGNSARIGTGFDLHRLEKGRPFFLGGIQIPCDRGPVGHSDGDPLLHALADALLGAAGLEDLGTLFPDSDPAHAGLSSSKIMQAVLAKVTEAGFQVGNLDAVVVTEVPKIAPHRQAIRENLASLIGLPVDRINLKGKSMEKMGEIGAGEAVMATAMALLFKP